MRVVVLAAGYGTRLEKDLLNNPGSFNNLLGLPKALLPIGQSPLLTHWVDIFQRHEQIEHVYVGTNAKYFQQFQQWAKQWAAYVSIVSDGTTSNTDRLGAVGSISFICKHFNIFGDVLVLAGDTLFFEDFSLDDMLKQFNQFKSTSPSSSLVPVYRCQDEDTVKHGILETDPDTNRVVSFLEKPKPSETTSRNACPCFYLLSTAAVKEISNFLEMKKDSKLEEKDATGLYLEYLCKKLDLFTYPISGRFDVGNLNSYIKCNNYFNESKK